ncbi:MAG TPA: zinc-finger-containing protein [Acidimicrobiia bacterium]|nr:zinc-finger-containing protein [Acidimicrobiia bacterium]
MSVRDEDLACPDCAAPMELAIGYGGRQYYRCERYPDCHGAHGAHPDGSPMGEPADARTRQARILAHEALDKLWMDAPLMYGAEALDPEKVKRFRRIARVRAYDWLAAKMGGAYMHIGDADMQACRDIIAICNRATPEIVRAWAKSNADDQRRAR